MKKYSLSIAFVLFIITGFLLNLNKLLFSMFFFILLHEIGHLITIKILGYSIYKIHILPFGLMIECNLNNNKSIMNEFLIYISGIVVNLFIIVIIKLYGFDIYYLKINLAIILFNIIPIIPLDGGRILLSLLSTKMRYKLAIKVSNVVGLICISLLILIGLWLKSINTLLMSIYLLIYNINNFRYFKKTFNEFLLSKYLYPNFYLKYHYVDMKEVGVENNYFRGKNNVLNNKDKNYYEHDILKKKFKDRKFLS